MGENNHKYMGPQYIEKWPKIEFLKNPPKLSSSLKTQPFCPQLRNHINSLLQKNLIEPFNGFILQSHLFIVSQEKKKTIMPKFAALNQNLAYEKFKMEGFPTLKQQIR